MKTDFEKLYKKLTKNFSIAVGEYSLVNEGDKIMICLSGGKDSYTLLDMFIHQQKVAPIDFEIIAVNLDQKQPGFPADVLPNYLEKLGVPFKIITQDTYSVVTDKIQEGKTMCSLCSRLRRGILYDTAQELGCNKLALGHHKDDILETFFLNLFFGGKIETMPPKYRTDDGRFEVIRPLAFCNEEDIESYSKQVEHPIIPCNLCGSQDGLQRQVVKMMIAKWNEKFPDRKDKMFAAMSNISPSHMLDKNLFDFKELKLNTEEIKVC